MAPNDTVRPTKLCIEIIRQFEPWHRGTALTHPDRFKCVKVQWHHKNKPVVMAGRYIEVVKADVISEPIVYAASAVL